MKKFALFLAVSTSLLAGCSTETRYAATGAGIGAVGGAAIGAGIGGNPGSALAGGTLGAIGGAVVGAALTPPPPVRGPVTYKGYARGGPDGYDEPIYDAYGGTGNATCTYRYAQGRTYVGRCPRG